jgi:predicted DNA-binding transcriptional regulator AlpA
VSRRSRLELLAEREADERAAEATGPLTKRESVLTRSDKTARASSTVRRNLDDTADSGVPSTVEHSTMPPVAVSVEAAATALGLSRTTAWELVRGGQLPAKRIRGRVVIRVVDLARFVEDQPDYADS